MQSSRLKSLSFALAFCHRRLLSWLPFGSKSLNLALVFCLLPLGLKAQTTPTPITISDAQTTVQALSAGQTLTVEATGSVILTTGTAVTGADGGNTITNSGEIRSDDAAAIIFQSLNTITNSGTITGTTTGIYLQGAALQATLDANATRPAHDAVAATRDAYYFNNKVINQVVGTNTGTITGKGTGHGINIAGARAQILNTGGTISAAGSGHGIFFNTGSGQGFVQNTGNITAADGIAIAAASGVNEITIHNDGGTIESTSGIAIVLQSLNLIVNSGNITGSFNGISLAGAALQATIDASPTAPAYDSTQTLRDAYYFNNKVINEVAGTITGTITAAGIGHGIAIDGARAQILNTGDIIATGTGSGIYFDVTSDQGFVYNAGNIRATGEFAIRAATNDSGTANEIVIHNTGTIENTVDSAIRLQSLNLIVNSGTITAARDGIQLLGTADPTMLTNNPTAPAYNAADAARDAYYFNNKVINEVGGTITGRGIGGGIYIAGARVQILNAGDIVAEGSDDSIYFTSTFGQGFIHNTGNITGASGRAIYAAASVAGTADEIIIHNTGTIESTASIAIILRSLNLIVNSGDIIGASTGIQLRGIADPTMLANNPTAPAYDSTQTLRDAYYFNNKVINEVGGTITGKGASSGIYIAGARVQILNAGDIIAEGTGHGIGLDAGQSFIQNTGSITAASGFAIVANLGVDAITIHNTGTIESTASVAIILRSLNLIVNSSDIIAASTGIQLRGTANATMLTNNPTAPAYDSTQTLRDAYYFNNKVINQTGGTITGKGVGHGIFIAGARVQILNAGDIIAEGTGHGVAFGAGAGQSFIQNTGSITAASGFAIAAGAGIDAIVIHNTGTLESTAGSAVALQGLSLLVNSSDIIGAFTGVELIGVANAAMVASNPTVPAYDATDAARDAYYFNNKVVNEVGGVITGKGAGNGIATRSARVQILNTGNIVAESTGHGILFGSESGQSLVHNTGSITAASGFAIVADARVNFIIIHNDGGTIESTASTAVVLESLSFLMNSGDITGAADGIQLAGTALAAGRAANPTAPPISASVATRDDYYFNNIVINQSGGTITGKGTGHGIRIDGARAQINNDEGSITAEGSGHGIFFSAGSGEGFVASTGSITAASGNAIHAAIGADEVIVANSDTGTIESTAGTAIVLRNLGVVFNLGDIIGAADAIHLSGTADADTIAANPTIPSYGSSGISEVDVNAYYFNNQVSNQSGSNITGKGTGHAIRIDSARAQILNDEGSITAEGSGHGIFFSAGSGQGFVASGGSISSLVSGNAIHAASGVDEIFIINTDTGTIGSVTSTAIVLQNLNLLVNAGNIIGGTDAIYLSGTADADTIADNPTAPAWDAPKVDRDAYYFNNIIANEVGGTITAKGSGHGIHVVDKRTQIFNHGDIIAEGTGHGIYFAAASGESIVVNTGNIISEDGWGIYAHNNTAGSIVIINGGCIEGGAGAIRLSDANDVLVIRTGSKIVGTVDFEGDTRDELIYADGPVYSPLASPARNLEVTTESDSDSPLGVVQDFLADADDGSGDSGAASLGNYQTLFALSDELILDLNAGIQGAIYEHNFSFSSGSASVDASENTPKKSSFWAQSFGSFRKQDASDDNAKADHTLGGILLGYDLARNQGKGIGLFLGAALGSLSTDDDAELTSQNFFGGVYLEFAKDKLFYGFNLTAGFTSHKSERSVEESDETVNIEGKYTGFFLSPEFILGLKAQMGSVNITPSLRVRYTFASLGSYDEDGDAESRISAEKRNTGTMESRAQVAFPLGLSSETWSFEPRLGLEHRIDLNKDSFDVQNLATETPIDYDAEKENTLGFFGGLSVAYLKANTAFKLNVDTIFSDESLVLRAQAGFGFQF